MPEEPEMSEVPGTPAEKLRKDYWDYRPYVFTLLVKHGLNTREASEVTDKLFKEIQVTIDTINSMVNALADIDLTFIRAKRRLVVANKPRMIPRLMNIYKIFDEGYMRYIEKLKGTANTLVEMLISLLILYNRTVEGRKAKIPKIPFPEVKKHTR